MRRILQAIASLKLTVVLVVLLAVVLSAATIVESIHGAQAARQIYFAPWFLFLLATFGANLVAAIVDRWPQTKWRIGFAITHLSLALILAGAMVTYVAKTEGQLPLWEGQQSSTVLSNIGPDGPSSSFELPFQVRCDDFQMDFYPGTRRPSMFRSKVTLVDASGERAAVIEMNKPLDYRGFRFFQSSYQVQGNREMTILSVSKDPGQTAVFVGYYMLIFGMIVVFSTRLVQARDARAAALLAIALLAAAAPAGAAQLPEPATADALREMPVQHDGRTMPLDTMARDSVWSVTGLRAWPGIDPVRMTLGWEYDAAGWSREPVVKVGGRDVALAVGLDANRRWASFEELVSSESLHAALDRMRARQETEETLSPVEKDLQKLENRLVTLDAFFRGGAIKAVPGAQPGAPWSPPPGQSPSDLVSLESRIRAAGAPADYPTAAAMHLERTYNDRRPSRIAWILLLVATLAAGFSQERDRFRLRAISAVALLAAFAVMTWGLVVRWQIAGRIPASNIYESMLFLGWGVAFFGVVAVLLRNRLLIFNAAAIAMLAELFTDFVPVDPFIRPMPPVLSGTPWLAIHVPIVMLSYSVFAMTALFGHMVVGVEIFAPKRRDLARRWSELLYYYIHVGSILLIAGILTGSIWAASSWGRYWGWDPKEVWSLVAFLAYMAILHARYDKLLGDFGVAISSIGAFGTILMTYLGVNFILAAGLHSYGFGSSRLASTLVTVGAVEVGFVLIGWAFRRRNLALVPEE